ncbi:MAG: hypothetical protein LHV68_07235 [Elusimicrobia bacterium]|nr:hypothetical protein [Candidatus Liberimonas magnetica]
MKKAITLITLFCFILSGVADQALYGIVTGVRDEKKVNEALGKIDGFILPKKYGRITGGNYSGGGALVVWIQDLHCHPEVQRNINEIIRFFDTKYNMTKLLIEGAPQGRAGTELLGTIPDEKLKQKTIDTLLSNGLLGGAEYYSVKEKKDTLYGLEDWSVYTENLHRIQGLLRHKEENRKVADEFNLCLKAISGRYGTKRLKKLNKSLAKISENANSPDKLYAVFENLEALTGESLLQYPNLQRYGKVLEAGRRLRYKKIAKEQAQYLGELRQVLSFGVYRQLMDMLNDTSRGADTYYFGLGEISRQYTPKMSTRYPHLSAFIEYIKQRSAINPIEVVREQNVFIKKAGDRCVNTLGDRELLFLERMGELLGKMAGLELSAEELSVFEKDIGRFTALLPKYFSPRERLGIEALAKKDELSRYYEVNRHRNKIFVQHILEGFSGGASIQAGVPGMAGSYQETAARLKSFKEVEVVVVGGFHEGMAAALKEKGISYLVVTPNVTSSYNREVYENVLANSPAPASLPGAAFAPPAMAGLIEKNDLERFYSTVALGAAEIELELPDKSSRERIAIMGEWLKKIQGELAKKGINLSLPQVSIERSDTGLTVQIQHEGKVLSYHASKKEDTVVVDRIVEVKTAAGTATGPEEKTGPKLSSILDPLAQQWFKDRPVAYKRFTAAASVAEEGIFRLSLGLAIQHGLIHGPFGIGIAVALSIIIFSAAHVIVSWLASKDKPYTFSDAKRDFLNHAFSSFVLSVVPYLGVYFLLPSILITTFFIAPSTVFFIAPFAAFVLTSLIHAVYDLTLTHLNSENKSEEKVKQHQNYRRFIEVVLIAAVVSETIIALSLFGVPPQVIAWYKFIQGTYFIAFAGMKIPLINIALGQVITLAVEPLVMSKFQDKTQSLDKAENSKTKIPLSQLIITLCVNLLWTTSTLAVTQSALIIFPHSVLASYYYMSFLGVGLLFAVMFLRVGLEKGGTFMRYFFTDTSIIASSFGLAAVFFSSIPRSVNYFFSHLPSLRESAIAIVLSALTAVYNVLLTMAPFLYLPAAAKEKNLNNYRNVLLVGELNYVKMPFTDLVLLLVLSAAQGDVKVIFQQLIGIAYYILYAYYSYLTRTSGTPPLSNFLYSLLVKRYKANEEDLNLDKLADARDKGVLEEVKEIRQGTSLKADLGGTWDMGFVLPAQLVQAAPAFKDRALNNMPVLKTIVPYLARVLRMHRELEGAGSEGTKTWLHTQVPGTAYAALIEHKIIPDPFKGMHEKDVQWVGETDFTFVKRFTVSPSLRKKDKVSLTFHGLDTCATIWINGMRLPKPGSAPDSLETYSADNMFTDWTYDVKDYLDDGENVIVVEFDAPMRAAREREQRWGTLGAVFSRLRIYLRKEQASFGWDWGPSMPDSGVWRSVELAGYDTAEVSDSSAEVTFEGDDLAHPLVTAQVELNKYAQEPFDVKVVLKGPDGTEVETKTIKYEDIVFDKAGKAQLSPLFAVENPQLWWPNGYGEHPLYQIDVNIFTRKKSTGERVLSSSKAQKFGIRKIELMEEEPGPDGKMQKCFRIKVNGIPIFAKGTAWIPSDSVNTHMNEERYSDLLTKAADSHYNMMRVWGGGYYEDEAFYRVCDEKGLLVWQDFMFACADYPESKEFTNSVKREVELIVKKLRSHPCIALWCGNNENQWQQQQGLFSSSTHLFGIDIYEKMIPEILGRLDPGRKLLYRKSSPWGGKNPNSFKEGDAHIWGIWDYSFYLGVDTLFGSEAGWQAPPDPRTISSYYKVPLGKERNPFDEMAKFHNKKEPLGPETIWHFMLKHFPKPGTYNDYVLYSQLNQGLALDTLAKHLRRINSGGCLVWQFNDIWPCDSWSVVDYFHRAKPAYYMLKRAFAPVLISIGREKSTEGSVVINNDRPVPVKGKAVITLSDFEGNIIKREERDITVKMGSSETVEIPSAMLNPSDRQSQFLSVEFYDDKNELLSQDIQFFREFKDIDLPASDAAINKEDIQPVDTRPETERRLPAETFDTFRVPVSAERFAPWAYLDIEGDIEIECDDNYFCILPGQMRTITVKTKQKMTPEEFAKRLVLRITPDKNAKKDEPSLKRAPAIIRDREVVRIRTGEITEKKAGELHSMAWQGARVVDIGMMDEETKERLSDNGVPKLGTTIVPIVFENGYMMYALVDVYGEEIEHYKSGGRVVQLYMELSEAQEKEVLDRGLNIEELRKQVSEHGAFKVIAELKEGTVLEPRNNKEIRKLLGRKEFKPCAVELDTRKGRTAGGSTYESLAREAQERDTFLEGAGWLVDIVDRDVGPDGWGGEQDAAEYLSGIAGDSEKNMSLRGKGLLRQLLNKLQPPVAAGQPGDIFPVLDSSDIKETIVDEDSLHRATMATLSAS